MAAIPIRSKADHTPAAPVAPGGAVPGPAKSNPGNWKEKRYLIFVQNREPEKFFSFPVKQKKWLSTAGCGTGICVLKIPAGHVLPGAESGYLLEKARF